MGVAQKLTKKYGNNLNESLGVRATSTTTDEGTILTIPAAISPDQGRTRQREAGFMEIERIEPDPNQPRKEFDTEALDRLAASLQRHGQLLPVRVRWNADLAKWIIISGERRYQAAKRAGLKTLACVFVDRALTESELLQEQIIENMLREDLKPIEQANAYKTLMELQSWNGAQLAEALNVSKTTVSRVLALLKLPSDIQQMVERGDIPATAAYEVAKLPTEESRREMAQTIIDGGYTRNEAVEVVRKQVDHLIQPKIHVPVLEPVVNEAGQGGGVADAIENQDNISIVDAPTYAADTPTEFTEEPAADRELPSGKRKIGRPRSEPKEYKIRVEDGVVLVRLKKNNPTKHDTIVAVSQALMQLKNSQKAES